MQKQENKDGCHFISLVLTRVFHADTPLKKGTHNNRHGLRPKGENIMLLDRMAAQPSWMKRERP
ncbi:hypothetical protein NB640_00740 [Oxalobacter vibrioformis]|uniref:Uncharacterized protein n=1 Tax=Oxalobacter vibrioformis TaxID=933080 RepID=A0A9E9P3N7_9BURK|nr:hypothetical protein [Oxalobacter vibrioformis]NLC24102.1 hypothetical protein [Oxalobacter sp.]WAW10228.1 hypothetical protein NB640_00740 [Oxalobacter vibrioformis]